MVNTKVYSIEEILKYFECRNIKYDIKRNDRNTYYEINLEFKYNLYTKNQSNEKYFNELVNTLARKIDISFELIDSSKNINIYYDCEERILTINGKEDFYKNNNFIKVANHKTINKVNTFVSNKVIMAAKNAEWQRDKLNIKDEIKDYNDTFIYYDNYKYCYDGIKINYIEFSKDYNETIIGNIKVGDDFNSIIKYIGEPQFEKNKRMIGYKTTDGYLFFYEDKVVVYPCLIYHNAELEEKIVSYINGEYEGYRTNLIKEILTNNNDIKCDIIEEGVKISSVTRGIEIDLYDNKDFKIVVYDNYLLGKEFGKLAQNGEIELNFEDDFVYLEEINKE